MDESRDAAQTSNGAPGANGATPAAGAAAGAGMPPAYKLNQRERAAALKEATSHLADGMTAQIFSAHDKTGVQTAQKRLLGMLSKRVDAQEQGS